MIDKRIRFRGGGAYQGGSKSPGSAESSGSKSKSNTSNSSGGENRPNPHRDSGYSITSTPTKPKTTTPSFNIHNDDPNAPEAYEIIGSEKFDVTPETKGERDEARAAVERAKVKQSILDAPIPNITNKGISFFKDGNLLSNSLMAGDNPLNKPKFNLKSLLLNAGMFAASPLLYGKYKKAKSLYSGARFVANTLSDLTGKNVSKPFNVLENLTKKINLKDKNVIESFKDSLTSTLVPKRKPVINTYTDNDSNDGIASLEKMDLLQDEYTTLLQKLQTGVINDEEQVRFNMLKNMLGI